MKICQPHEKQNGLKACSGWCWRGCEGEAERGSAALEGSDAALTLLLFIVLLPLIDVGLASRQHEVHHPRQLVGGGRVGTRLVHSPRKSAVERAQRRVAVRQAHRRHLQRLPDPVARALGLARQHPSPADLRAWAQAQPRAEVLDVGESAQVRTWTPPVCQAFNSRRLEGKDCTRTFGLLMQSCGCCP